MRTVISVSYFRRWRSDCGRRRWMFALPPAPTGGTLASDTATAWTSMMLTACGVPAHPPPHPPLPASDPRDGHVSAEAIHKVLGHHLSLLCLARGGDRKWTALIRDSLNGDATRFQMILPSRPQPCTVFGRRRWMLSNYIRTWTKHDLPHISRQVMVFCGPGPRLWPG
ncbi:hypothetical protein M433DRAFT_289452 [Acidomyces richmondensis BFW]|nr:MAG: hypothetical protein FE78DRAFT_473175 [Acidomyces sp. 'richmondensis']KYG44724.1 hypothetical protein M433DRAFT_289452 [Acidomyces richmondensis BFW]